MQTFAATLSQKNSFFHKSILIVYLTERDAQAKALLCFPGSAEMKEPMSVFYYKGGAAMFIFVASLNYSCLPYLQILTKHHYGRLLCVRSAKGAKCG